MESGYLTVPNSQISNYIVSQYADKQKPVKCPGYCKYYKPENIQAIIIDINILIQGVCLPMTYIIRVIEFIVGGQVCSNIGSKRLILTNRGVSKNQNWTDDIASYPRKRKCVGPHKQSFEMKKG